MVPNASVTLLNNISVAMIKYVILVSFSIVCSENIPTFITNEDSKEIAERELQKRAPSIPSVGMEMYWGEYEETTRNPYKNWPKSMSPLTALGLVQQKLKRMKPQAAQNKETEDPFMKMRNKQIKEDLADIMNRVPRPPSENPNIPKWLKANSRQEFIPKSEFDPIPDYSEMTAMQNFEGRPQPYQSQDGYQLKSGMQNFEGRPQPYQSQDGYQQMSGMQNLEGRPQPYQSQDRYQQMSGMQNFEERPQPYQSQDGYQQMSGMKENGPPKELEDQFSQLTKEFSNRGPPMPQSLRGNSHISQMVPEQQIKRDQPKRLRLPLKVRAKLDRYRNVPQGAVPPPPRGPMHMVEQRTLRPKTLSNKNATLPALDDFQSPIKWVMFSSKATRDGLAKVTDPKTGKNWMATINGTVFVPVADYNPIRLGLTTLATSTLKYDMMLEDNVLRTVSKSMDLDDIDERDWLAIETALGGRNDPARCSGDTCQARCHTMACESMCGGDTCASGCVGASCSTYCKGPGCLAMCIGEECSAKCDGLNCDARCRGRSCQSKCGGFSCQYSINGKFAKGGGTWEDYKHSQVQTGVADMPAPISYNDDGY